MMDSAQEEDSFLLPLLEIGGNVETLQGFYSWRRKIRPLFHLLDKPPSDELEALILSQENKITANNPIFKDPNLISKCQKLYESLLELFNKAETECLQLWEEVQSSSDKMLRNKDIGLGFSLADARIIKILRDLTAQIKSTEDVKRNRIAEVVEEVREEIGNIWNVCMITDEEKGLFKEYSSKDYTEELLQIHYKELETWQIYHKKNLEILNKIRKRDQMWRTLRELEARADDPNRFVNRGGALLKDQNMHNCITKNLPKLETELVNLAKKFEQEHGKKMKILGIPIKVMIDEEWAKFKKEKVDRKNQKLQGTSSSSVGLASSSNRKSIARPRQSVMPVPFYSGTTRSAAKRVGPKLHTITDCDYIPSPKKEKVSCTEALQSRDTEDEQDPSTSSYSCPYRQKN